jgi:hypothetical protein
MSQGSIDIRLEVGAFVITLGKDPEGLFVIKMTPGRILTLGGRRVQSKRSTYTVEGELAAWERVGRLNEIAKSLGQAQALDLGLAVDDALGDVRNA